MGISAFSWIGVASALDYPKRLCESQSGQGQHARSRELPAVKAILEEPEMKARIAELGRVSMAASPAGFGNTIAAETEKMRKGG
jgi:hypothetical protein